VAAAGLVDGVDRTCGSGDAHVALDLAAFLPELDELITEGLVILDDVQVVKYVGRGHEDAPSGVGCLALLI
jgi:hypothetical protein